MSNKIVWLVVLFILLISGCTKSGAPACSDDNVKKIVIDLSTARTRDSVAYNGLKNWARPLRVAGIYENIKEQMSNEFADKSTVKQFQTLLDHADRTMAQLSFNLTDIRFKSKQDDIKKSSCIGSFIITNNESHKSINNAVEYDAQFTSEGKLIVELTQY